MKQLELKESSNRIDRKCIEAGLSRRELARRCGVPVRTLEAWASGKRIPRDVYQLYKVAQALGCHIEDLIDPELAEAQEKENRPEE